MIAIYRYLWHSLGIEQCDNENLLFIEMNQTTFGYSWPKTHWWYHFFILIVLSLLNIASGVVVFSIVSILCSHSTANECEIDGKKTSESKITLSHGEAHESIVHYGCDVMSLPCDFYNLIIGAAKHRHSVARISCCQFASKTPSPKPVTPLKGYLKRTTTTMSVPSL